MSMRCGAPTFKLLKVNRQVYLVNISLDNKKNCVRLRGYCDVAVSVIIIN